MYMKQTKYYAINLTSSTYTATSYTGREQCKMKNEIYYKHVNVI